MNQCFMFASGLLSMRVTENDEMCGIFNITFKAIPQLDLRNVVFGRVKLYLILTCTNVNDRSIFEINLHRNRSIGWRAAMQQHTTHLTYELFNISSISLIILFQVIRPNVIFENMQNLGLPLSTQPIVEIVSTKRYEGEWINGVRNTKLQSMKNQIL